MAACDIRDLEQSLSSMTKIAHRMLDLQDKIDLEFLSDLTNIISSLQSLISELEKQGFGRLED